MLISPENLDNTQFQMIYRMLSPRSQKRVVKPFFLLY